MNMDFGMIMIDFVCLFILFWWLLFYYLGKLYVSFEKVYNNMIGNIISFYRIFVLCNLDVWFRNYGKSCEVPLNLFGLIH